MTKQCIVCKKNVELITDEDKRGVFFNIIQATTIHLERNGDKSSKRQSTSYLCEKCLDKATVHWSQLIHHLWIDGVIHFE